MTVTVRALPAPPSIAQMFGAVAWWAGILVLGRAVYGGFGVYTADFHGFLGVRSGAKGGGWGLTECDGLWPSPGGLPSAELLRFKKRCFARRMRTGADGGGCVLMASEQAQAGARDPIEGTCVGNLLPVVNQTDATIRSPVPLNQREIDLVEPPLPPGAKYHPSLSSTCTLPALSTTWTKYRLLPSAAKLPDHTPPAETSSTLDQPKAKPLEGKRREALEG